MKFLDLGLSTSQRAETRIGELSDALDQAQRKVAERDLLVSEALDHTEAVRAQYEQAHARAETLRRHLSSKEEQVIALQDQIRQRDDKIAALEKSIKSKGEKEEEAKPHTAVTALDQLSKMNLALESLDHPGTMYKINRPVTTIGRNAMNDVAIDSNSVSRFHARLLVEDDGIFLVDLDSTNGCKVNGIRITRQMIGNADAITIGHAKFRFSVEVSPELEARGMQETHVLLNDSVILVPSQITKPQKNQ